MNTQPDDSTPAEDSDARIRLKFFGVDDYGTYFQVDRAVEVFDALDAASAPTNLNDILELFNAQQFVEGGFLPKDLTDAERDALRARLPNVRRVIAQFFAGMTDSSLPSLITEVDFQYRDDLLNLLSRHKVHERCTAAVLLEALRAARVSCRELLTSKQIVRAYDADIKLLLSSDPKHAELIVAKHLQPEGRDPINLPSSWSPADSLALLDAYLDDEARNPNFVQMIATARVSKETGINRRLKLKAQRKYDEFNAEFFNTNTGIKTGVEISVSPDQAEEVITSLDGMVAKFSYSEVWLSENLDFPTVLNNFVYLFEFASPHMQWLLPSFAAELGVFERFMGPEMKESYRTGASFRLKDQSSFLQTVMYDQFLRSNDIELEAVLAWFFEQYLTDQFSAGNFRYKASSPAATYLEKSRHLFAEMECVLKQFSLYVEEGEVDRQLLSMTSEQLTYRAAPSLMNGKYVYTREDRTINRIQHVLFSDQSHVTYISNELKDDSFARLIIRNAISYGNFHEYQQAEIDFLIAEGVVEDTGDRIKISSAAQFMVLRDLWDFEAASYYHYAADAKAAVDSMVDKGWLERRSSLLTGAEASYVNYFLNQSEFTDGPDLRNRYLHGSQADGDDNRVHFQAYITALRLLIALVIKINDDFWLRADEADEDDESRQ